MSAAVEDPATIRELTLYVQREPHRARLVSSRQVAANVSHIDSVGDDQQKQNRLRGETRGIRPEQWSTRPSTSVSQ